MASYKKSFLSAAAAMAISASVVSADYLPLANTALDDKWMLFGASGFLAAGSVDAGVQGVFTIDDTAANRVQDTFGGHELFETSGLTVAGGDLGAVKALNAQNNTVLVRVDTDGAIFNDTEPTRTIYVDTDGDGIGDFAFTYKAQLEGKRLEYRVGTGDAYFVTINYANTFDNPVAGAIILGSDAVAGIILNDLVETGKGTVIDYTFENNPVNYLNFDARVVASGGHRDLPAGDESLRLYSYDANNGGLWNLFDSRYANESNDFLALDKGRGYWGKLDMDALGANAPAGLVLGTSTVTPADYQALNLTEGWNLLAFNKPNNTELRHANTGLIVTFQAGPVAQPFAIRDSSRTQEIQVTPINGATIDETARAINFAIAQAKAQGTLPKTFDLKAFPTGTLLQLALVSNKKFSIHEVGANDVIGAATTLAGGEVIDLDPTVEDFSDFSAGDVDVEGVSSVYGEYAVVIKPLPADNDLADAINNSTLNIVSELASVANGTNVSYDISDAAPDLSTVATALTSVPNGLLSNELDIDLDGTSDHVLIASTEPFYLRDQTFSRVFTVPDNTSGAGGTLTITGAGAQSVGTVTIAAAANRDAIAQTIDGLLGNFIQADVDADNNIIIVATDSDASDFAVFHTSGADFLNVSSSDNDMAKGSVADVYSLSHLAKKAITNDVVIEVDETTAPTVDDTFTFTYNTFFDTLIPTLTATTATVVAGDLVDATTKAAFFDSLVEQINLTFTTNGVNATASHDHDGLVDDFDTLITITGADVIAASLVYVADATGVVVIDNAFTGTSLGYLSNLEGDLATDLKYNAVYTPNYVMDGPLYTMREAGFDLKALVTGTMPMDIVGSTMQWDSIDLTRVPSQWFSSQDYNLFDTDEKAGYWGYLEENATPNPLSIGTISLSPLDYVHYYDVTVDGSTTTRTTTNAFSTNIKVEVNGIDETRDPHDLPGLNGSKSARVTASIGGRKVELTRESQNLYSGKISFYEVDGINANTAFDIIIDAADGLGNKISTATGIVDNSKPAAPVASIDGSTITVSSTSDDVAAYYVFETTVPEVYSTSDEMLRRENEPDGEVIGSGVCGTAVTSGSSVGALAVVAVDGIGTFYKGNISNITNVPYMAIAKDRVILSDINNNETDMSVGGTPYSTTCTAGTPVTTNDYAMQFASMTNTKTAKIAFDQLESGADLTGVPITVYVRNDTSSAVAKITYAPVYENTGVFVMLDGQVYGYTLPGRAAAEATTPTTGINLNAFIKAGVTF